MALEKTQYEEKARLEDRVFTLEWMRRRNKKQKEMLAAIKFRLLETDCDGLSNQQLLKRLELAQQHAKEIGKKEMKLLLGRKIDFVKAKLFKAEQYIDQ